MGERDEDAAVDWVNAAQESTNYDDWERPATQSEAQQVAWLLDADGLGLADVWPDLDVASLPED